MGLPRFLGHEEGDIWLGAEGLEVEWAEVADRRVAAARVVEALDVLEGGAVDGLGAVQRGQPAMALR